MGFFALKLPGIKFLKCCGGFKLLGGANHLVPVPTEQVGDFSSLNSMMLLVVMVVIEIQGSPTKTAS